jgi:hypothetical protein
MSARTGWRLLLFSAGLVVLSGCATNRILKCEGRLVPINPPPPKPAMAKPAPAQKSPSPRRTEHEP